jgi:hypothetical protein
MQSINNTEANIVFMISSKGFGRLEYHLFKKFNRLPCKPKPICKKAFPTDDLADFIYGIIWGNSVIF